MKKLEKILWSAAVLGAAYGLYSLLATHEKTEEEENWRLAGMKKPEVSDEYKDLDKHGRPRKGFVAWYVTHKIPGVKAIFRR